MCCACNTEEHQENPSDSTDSTTNSSISENADTTLSNQDVETYIWEKEKDTVTFDTLVLDANWHKGITVGGTFVSSLGFTDVSETPNYYWADDESYGEFEAGYYVPKTAHSVKTDMVPLHDFFFGQMEILTTTYNNHNLFIEGVRFVGVANTYEGDGLDFVRQASEHSGDKFGIGSTYEDVIKLIGEPDNKWTEQADTNLMASTCVFIEDNAELMLVFAHMDTEDDAKAVLTSVIWTPTKLKEALHIHYNESIEE